MYGDFYDEYFWSLVWPFTIMSYINIMFSKTVYIFVSIVDDFSRNSSTGGSLYSPLQNFDNKVNDVDDTLTNKIEPRANIDLYINLNIIFADF